MFVIDDIINAILALSNVVKQAQRQESVLKILKKFNFDPKHPPADFTGVYQYALVEYGASQLGILNQEDLRLVLELFRQKEIKQAFERAFNGDNPRIFLNQVEKYIEEYALGDDISDRSINLLPELAKFSDIFIQIVKRTRNPAEVRRDRKLDNLQAELKSAIDQLNQRFESLDSLPEKISQNLLSLPAGDRPEFSKSNFTQQLHNWFEALYDFEREDVWESDYFEWIVQVPARRRYDRILVRGIEGEANINDLKALEESVEKYNTDEGWLVAPSRVSQAVRDQVEGDRRLFCYTFDELIDEAVNFSGYLNWLETEVKRQKNRYIICTPCLY
jgi:predicted NACHT family NTPase